MPGIGCFLMVYFLSFHRPPTGVPAHLLPFWSHFLFLYDHSLKTASWTEDWGTGWWGNSENFRQGLRDSTLSWMKWEEIWCEMTRCGLVNLEIHGVTLSPVGMWTMENTPNLPGDLSEQCFLTTRVLQALPDCSCCLFKKCIRTGISKRKTLNRNKAWLAGLEGSQLSRC